MNASLHALLLWFVLALLPIAHAQTAYTSVQSGNWNTASTWQGGTIPPQTLPVGSTITINHSVTYNLGGDFTNRGYVRIATVNPLPAAPGALIIPTGRSYVNETSGRLEVTFGKIQHCRFVGCGNSGSSQSGKLENKGGQMTVTNSVIEIAQDWTNESGGRRVIRNSCVSTGQNFSLSGSSSFDSLENTSVSIGWHGSGNVQYSDGTFHSVGGNRFQLAGTSGSFQLNSGTAFGSIEYITLKNHVTNNTGSGQIVASSSVTVSGTLVLNAHWETPASNYIPNGKFSGAQTRSDITSTYFPDTSCSYSNALPPGPLSCNAVYGSYAGATSTTFNIATVSSTSGTRTNYVTSPNPLQTSRGNAAAITPDGRYYYYRSNTGNTLMRYDSQLANLENTGQTFSTDHFRMGIDPTGTYGYVSRQNAFQRFLVASPYTISNISVVEQGAPSGLEYANRAGGDIAFDSAGFAYSVTRRGGTGSDQYDNFLYRLDFSTSTAVVTATFLGQITSSDPNLTATFAAFDLNGLAFLNGTLYLGGGATALGGDAQLWSLNLSTRQANFIGTDSAGSNDVPITDLASCEYPNIKIPVNLSATKTNGTDSLVAGQTTGYTITYTNSSIYPVFNATVQDSPSAGLSACSVTSCSATGTSQCPGSFANFFSPAAGVVLPQLAASSSVTIRLQCNVTATGL